MLQPPARDLPDIGDVRSAARRICGVAVETPLLEAPALGEIVGCRVLIKAEMLQRTGSFKFRGAYNRLSRLTAEQRRAGVVAYSSGNHAQGVAAAARLLGVPALIVMPADAPAIKIDNTRGYGAEVVTYDRHAENREEIGGRIAEERGATIVPPYDHPHVIAGQGTCGLELVRQAVQRDAELDAVLVPCGGGGLSAGINLAIAAESPGTAVYAVEPAEFDDTRRSLEAGERVGNPVGAASICDSLLARMPGELTFAINRRLLAGVLTVSDDEAGVAMRLAFRWLKLVFEPGGAVALAALLAGRAPALRGRTVAVVASGGNVDPALFARVLQAG